LFDYKETAEVSTFLDSLNQKKSARISSSTNH